MHTRYEKISMTLIAACDRSGAIGKNGALPFNSKKDLRHFKAVTSGHTVLMGRKTYENVYQRMGAPDVLWPNRNVLVLTRKPQVPGAQAVIPNTIREFVPKNETVMFVAGGEQVYDQFYPYCDTALITHFDIQVEDADAWLPRGMFEQYKERRVVKSFDGAVVKEYDKMICWIA